ncbi:MAG TPA: serine hydrolase domain-containing protein [Bacteroidales bacterium]|nr:serine hydrolase domain-containing protein [Bacteroidales bacterium]
MNYLDKRVPELMRHYKIPGVSISVLKKGQIIWSNSYGYADVQTGRNMTNDSYYRVESISKSLTAWGVMKLVEQGKLDLDQPVMTYFKNRLIPDSEYSVESVTLRMLLTHTSGMPLGAIGLRYSPGEEKPALRQQLSADALLKQEPGKSFSYSNTGFNILEALIEEVTERDFSEFMKNELLLPLGMEHSSFEWNESFNDQIPTGYDLKGNPVSVYVYAEKASGGLFASVADIATFLTAGMTYDPITDRKVINAQSINELYTPQAEIHGFYGLAFDSYGFGHFIETLSNGKIAVSHGGQGTGWMTHFHSVPSTGDGIVILTNSQRSWLLISHLLTDWAEWNGFTRVGMSRIIYGEKIVWSIIALIMCLLLWRTVRFVVDVCSGRRFFRPLAKSSWLSRSIQLAGFGVIVTVLVWATTRKYLFICSLYPSASAWLGYELTYASALLLLFASFPFESRIVPARIINSSLRPKIN